MRRTPLALLAAALVVMPLAVMSPSAALSPVAGALFTPSGPTRVLDTRETTRLDANVERQIDVDAGPDDVGVSLNLTITRAATDGFATIHPCGSAISTSTVNFRSGIDVANAAPMVPVSSGVCVTSSVRADAVVDHTGWWSLSSGTAMTSHNPVRLLDSRSTAARPLQRTIPRWGTDPAALTVIITRPSAAGFATVHPCSAPVGTSNLNFKAGQTVANLVLTAAAELCVTTSVPADVVVDEVAAAGAGALPAISAPRRILDTRDQVGWVGAGGLVRLPVGSARSVALNVTAVRPLGGGFVTVWPCNETEPNASALSWSDTTTVATAVLASADSNGDICLRPSVGTHLLADALASDAELPASITPQITGRTNELLLGRSVLGRPITAKAYGTATGVPVLGVGNIHGDEQSGFAIVDILKISAVPAGKEMWIVETANPDGTVADTRQNSNGVDLNRNWPTNWQPIPRTNNYSGPGPLSEPETRAMKSFLDLIKPHVGVWWHTVGDYVDDSRSSVDRPDLIDRYASTAAIGIDDAPCLGYCGGTATQYANNAWPGSTHMVVELPSPLSSAGAGRHAHAFLTITAAL